MFERSTGHAIRVGGYRADGLVAQLGIHFAEFLPQRAGEHGSGQLAVRDLHGVLPADRPRGLRRRHERLDDALDGRLGGAAHFSNSLGRLVAHPAVRVGELFDQNG
jgi:hypothetical protein